VSGTQNLIVVSGTLQFGILVEGQVHKDFTLRPATLNDSYRATEAVPLPVIEAQPGATVEQMVASPGGVAYRMAIDDATILCQLVRLGTLDPVPGPAALMQELEPDDMATLRKAAEEVKKSLGNSRSGAASSSGAPSSSSSEPATT
jgi:hypothetical protein